MPFWQFFLIFGQNRIFMDFRVFQSSNARERISGLRVRERGKYGKYGKYGKFGMGNMGNIEIHFGPNARPKPGNLPP